MSFGSVCVRVMLVFCLAFAGIGKAVEKPQVGSSGNERPTLTIIGIDALEWEALNYLRKLGKLPTFDRYIEDGASGPLESYYPMFSPMVWTSIATGRSPLEHGIQGFKMLNPDTGNKVPVNRTMRRTKAFWNILSKRGKSSLIAGWYATWPAEKIKGTMISDYTWPLKNRDKTENFLEEEMGLTLKEQTYPRHLYKDLKRFFIDKFADNENFSRRFGIAVKDAPYALKHSYAKDLTYYRMFQHMRTRQKYDVSAVYIQGPDLLAHKFWPEFHALVQGKLRSGTESYKKSKMIVDYYMFVDDMLDLYERRIRQPNETVMLVSDHGFEDRGKPILTKISDSKYAKKRSWHKKYGAIIAHGPHIKNGHKLVGATIFDITPTILAFFNLPIAKDMQGIVLKPLIRQPMREKVKMIASYEVKKKRARKAEGAAKSNIRESAYDKEIMKSLNELGYIQ